MKLLSNIPIEDLTPENDYLGIIEKGDMIASLLRSGNIDFKEIKMFALYGNWGSGKSTLMKYLQKELKDEFNTFYFDAWQYENGRDLSYSLLEFMYEEGISDTEKTAEKMLDVAKRVLIGTAKGFTFKTPVVNFNTKELMNELENDKESSFHSQIKEFKTEFEHFEGVLYQEKGGKKKTNIVFIDDLDRCEPEKVLDLLSEIKLFFTYGVKTIFFFGVDQKAVEIAVRSKYREIVKSNEYLEKIFDLSFSMPVIVNIEKLTGLIFPNKGISQMNNRTSVNRFIADYFQKMEIVNPRKIKKILNHYMLLLGADDRSRLVNHRGLIYTLQTYDSALHILYCIHLITLNQLATREFDNFGSSTEKTQIMHSVTITSLEQDGNLAHYGEDLDSFLNRIDLNKSLDTIFKNSSSSDDFNTDELIYLGMPTNLIKFHHELLRSSEKFKEVKVAHSSLSLKFTEFVFEKVLPFYKHSLDDRTNLSVANLKILIMQMS